MVVSYMIAAGESQQIEHLQLEATHIVAGSKRGT